MVTIEPRYKEHSRFSDDRLSQYISSVDDGVLIGMQPGITGAIALLGHPSVVRIGQEHRPFISRRRDLRSELLPYYAKLDMFLTLTERDRIATCPSLHPAPAWALCRTESRSSTPHPRTTPTRSWWPLDG